MLGLVTGTPPAGATTFSYSVVASNGVSPDATAGPFTVTVSRGGSGISLGVGASIVAPRLAGPDRIATAIRVSQAAFPQAGSAGAVLLARDDGFADALAGTPLAAVHHAPILLTDTATLDPATQAEVQRVLPVGGTVYFLGGADALDDGIAADLEALGYKTDRIAGPDRYATAAAIADALGDPTTVLLADGTTFPDALAAGAAAARLNGAVLLTDGPLMHPSTQAWLLAHPPTTVYAVGGPAATADPAARDIAGDTCYGTAADVASQFFPNPTLIGLASGTNYADALTGGATVAESGGPIILTDPATLPAETQTYLESVRSSLATIDVFGGSDAISNTVAAAAQQAG